MYEKRVQEPAGAQSPTQSPPTIVFSTKPDFRWLNEKRHVSIFDKIMQKSRYSGKAILKKFGQQRISFLRRLQPVEQQKL